MATVNKVIILGNLGKDPEIRHLENGRMRAQLTVATHDTYKTKEGEKINHTDWHEVVLWTPHAEIAAQYLSKGKQVYIEGKLNHRSYTDKDGQQRYSIQITCQHLVLLGGSKTKTQGVHVINHRPENRPHENDDMSELPL
ncbi:MAG: single-stranded DNA-binding protein [Candidatus Cardinium sp.]|uniref:single-stranded DNA-binding protein n=1 Tax=Cardinium endosymbiont of Dermatophagoides farinae TaxID=2597823 RepID=UPI0011838EA7|nr:single-stranded DNA-binding protein [Cardinium endosymbiont of Dermatophagoides farinae]TSJ80686.1 single-stranded DNA-binding protein [Cardinium endosymbiont of Dermatophagoides farinae]UWW96679.1 MAG: single-stranded DNA-binding protein [Candidatus Cardinium sp.]